MLDIFSDDNLLDSIGSAVGCDLSAHLKADMVVNPVYMLEGSQCVSARPSASGSYFADSGCTQPLEYQRTSQQQFCVAALDKSNLGQGGNTLEERQWTLSPGTAYDVGAASIEGLQQPYRSSVTYRSIDTPRGQCQLEMRVYKNDLRDGQSSHKPLIAVHGGSWSSRGFGTFGIEASVAKYTDQGFVVFAPFYRLLGDREGSAACNMASLPEITSDINAALLWVENNAQQYGVAGKPVVIGQSAGGHLALSLAVNFPERVAGALLFYPPTDFEDFLSQAQNGAYTNDEGLGILSRVLGEDATQYDVSLTPVPENSFPALVEPEPDIYPPVFIMHGLADELVPARQSMRLCNALAGRPVEQLFDTPLYRNIDCGDGSELNLFAEGNHALDICLVSGGLLAASCLSGSEQSRQLVADQIDRSASWAAFVSRTEDSAGGGALSLSVVLFLLLFGLIRIKLVGVRHHS